VLVAVLMGPTKGRRLAAAADVAVAIVPIILLIFLERITPAAISLTSTRRLIQFVQWLCGDSVFFVFEANNI
jgi:hypothetical protein